MESNDIKMRVFFDRIIYDNNDNYIVIGFSTEDEKASFIPQSNKFSKKGTYAFTAVLKDYILTFEFDKSKEYKLEGTWEDGKYGKYFKIAEIQQLVGKNKESIIAFLTEISGVGKATAKKIYNYFGDDTIEILENDFKKLYQVPRLSKKVIDTISAEFSEKKEFSELLVFLNRFSIPQKKAYNVYQIFGSASRGIIEDNPFIVSGAEAITFVEANAIALEEEVAISSQERITQALQYVAETKIKSFGDLYFKRKKLIEETTSFLHKGLEVRLRQNKLAPIPIKRVEDCLSKAIENNLFYEVGEFLYIYKDFYAEKTVAKRVIDFVHCPYSQTSLDEETCLNDISELEKSTMIFLNSEQKDAIVKTMTSNFSIITGGPGTGKSTLLKFIIEIFKKNFDENIGLCSPTGKAARRMAECTGISSACTVHSLLEITPDTPFTAEYKPTKQINYSLLVVDEVSMLDMRLMCLLMLSIPYRCKVVFLGDVDQLPSVGAGAVLKDMIDSNVVPTSVLTKIYRQAKNSAIIKNSCKINNLKFDFDTSTDEFRSYRRLIKVDEMVVDVMKSLLNKGIKADDIQILSPYRSLAFESSTGALNPKLQELLNPASPSREEAKVGKTLFREGDRVIQQKNGPKMKNGDVGKLLKIYYQNNSQLFAIDFGDEILSYDKNEMVEYNVELAYAITVHKSQGSEYKHVIMPVIKEHIPMLTKRLVYTAWTRAKKSVSIVGNINVLEYSVTNTKDRERKTYFKQRLIARENQYIKAEKGR